MKFSIIYLFILHSITSIAQIKSSVLVTFDKSKITQLCGSGFIINNSLESEELWKLELQKYLYKAFVDYKQCEESPSNLFKRGSFMKMILHIYDDSSFVNNSIYEYSSRWKESYMNLLYYCKDSIILYRLTDSLLLRNIDDGLIALWDKDISKLKLLKKYTLKNMNNEFAVYNLIAIFHNHGLKKQKHKLLKHLKATKSDNIIYDKLINLINTNANIDYFTFMEVIYGGM